MFLCIFSLVDIRKENQRHKVGDTDIQLLQEELDRRDESITDLVDQLEHANAQIA